MKNNTIRNVVATGIGAALFVVIGMINIPTPVPNTSIQLQYPLQALFSVIFGPIVGFLMGFIGHAIKDAMSGGGLWWFWITGSGVFGLLVGFFRKFFQVEEGKFEVKDIIRFNLIQFGANAIAWLIGPIGDVIVSGEPVNKVIAQSIVAILVNSATVAVIGTVLLTAYARTRTRAGSLKKD